MKYTKEQIEMCENIAENENMSITTVLDVLDDILDKKEDSEWVDLTIETLDELEMQGVEVKTLRIHVHTMDDKKNNMIRACLDYCYHRITKHEDTGIEGVVGLAELDKLRREF